MNKIPTNCLSCGNELRLYDMEQYMRLCEQTGKDPLEAARKNPPGILCMKCVLLTLMDQPEGSIEKKVFNKLSKHVRFRANGLKVIEGGKK